MARAKTRLSSVKKKTQKVRFCSALSLCVRALSTSLMEPSISRIIIRAERKEKRFRFKISRAIMWRDYFTICNYAFVTERNANILKKKKTICEKKIRPPDLLL